MKKIIIQIDSREKKPFAFKGNYTEVKNLKTGDYSIKGAATNGICIERKSLDDFFGTLTKSNNAKRFEKAMSRMKPFFFKGVVVEALPERILSGHYKCKASGQNVLNYFLKLCVTFQVSPIFCNGRKEAEKMTLELLNAYHVSF